VNAGDAAGDLPLVEQPPASTISIAIPTKRVIATLLERVLRHGMLQFTCSKATDTTKMASRER
jgi:hypothetical protein